MSHTTLHQAFDLFVVRALDRSILSDGYRKTAQSHRVCQVFDRIGGFHESRSNGTHRSQSSDDQECNAESLYEFKGGAHVDRLKGRQLFD